MMAAPSITNRQLSILIINPNTSARMTDALKPIINGLNYAEVRFSYFTAPSESVTLPDGRIIHGLPSINCGEDSVMSALHCRPFLLPLVSKYDGFLVACYSAHPLVGMLKEEIKKLEDAATASATTTKLRRRYVTGIFETSVTISLSLISSFVLLDEHQLSKSQVKDTFGVISTGKVWEEELRKAVTEMLADPSGQRGNSERFAGVKTTGLTAIELHSTPPEIVRQKIIEATESLIKDTFHPVGAICMGCAGMAGMEEAVREGCVKVYGKQQGHRVRIVDGVVAGAGILVASCKAGF